MLRIAIQNKSLINFLPETLFRTHSGSHLYRVSVSFLYTVTNFGRCINFLVQDCEPLGFAQQKFPIYDSEPFLTRQGTILSV